MHISLLLSCIETDTDLTAVQDYSIRAVVDALLWFGSTGFQCSSILSIGLADCDCNHESRANHLLQLVTRICAQLMAEKKRDL